MHTARTRQTAKPKYSVKQRALRKLAYNFIRLNRAGALATVGTDSKPAVAFVYFAVHEDLTVYFSTRAGGRKFENLQTNPHVSVAFANELEMTSIQLDGHVERVEALDEEQAVLHELIMIRYGEAQWPIPPVKLFEQGLADELAIMKIVPSQMTYACFQSSKTKHRKPFFRKVI